MTGLLAVASVVGFSATVIAAQDDSAKSDLKQLQGKWDVVAHILDGKPNPVRKDKSTFWTISGNKVLYWAGREDTIRLNATYVSILAGKNTEIPGFRRPSSPCGCGRFSCVFEGCAARMDRYNATKEPRELDVDSLENGKVLKGIPAIYALDGDTLILCVGIVNKERPTNFETRGKLGQRILVLRRVKSN
jgi:hypothetical protein